MYKIMLGQRMDLRFVLKPAKRMRKNDTIIILFKSAARLFAGGGRMADALRGKKLNPIHNPISSKRQIFLRSSGIETASRMMEFNDATLIRSCFIESRSRRVTVSSCNV